MSAAGFSYESCVAASERVYWSLPDACAALDFDFERPFLPERIAGTGALELLDDTERLKLNQIRGFAYAHLFHFVEEFIVPIAASCATAHVHTEPVAMRAMLRFCEEELKHQALFSAMKTAFLAGFGSPCEGVGGRVETAEQVGQRPDASVLLLTSMLEWITQRHYLECFRSTGASLCPAFREVFRLHWVEEAQHAKLDSLELQRLARGLDAAARESAVDDLAELCDAVDALLAGQLERDLDALQTATGRPLRIDERDRVREVQRATYRWTFLGSGLDHPVFQQVVADLAPERGPARLAALSERFAV